MKMSSNLMTRFSVVGVMITLLVAAALGYLMQADLTSNALADAGALAAAQVVASASPLLVPADFNKPLSEERIAELDRLVTGDLAGSGSVVRVKIWNPQGTIVYSDEKQLIGKNFGLSSDVRAALTGRTVSVVSALSGVDNASERQREAA